MNRSLLFLLGLLPLALGCPGTAGSDDDDSGDDDDAANDDDVTDDDDVVDDDDDATAEPVAPWVRATLLDCNGDPVTGVNASACQGAACFFSSSDATGTIVVDNLTEGAWVFHNLSWPGDDQATAIFANSSVYDIPSIVGTTSAELGTRTVPCTTETQAIGAGAQQLSFDGGTVVVSFNGDDIDLPFPASEATAPTLGAVTVEAGNQPTSGYEGAIQAAWAFSPFEAALTAGEFELDIDLGTAPADPSTIKVFYAHYEEDIESGAFSESSDVTVDGSVVTAHVATLGLVLVTDTSR